MTKDDIQHPFSNILLGSLFRNERDLFVKMCDMTAASFRKLGDGSAVFEPAIDFDPEHMVEVA